MPSLSWLTKESDLKTAANTPYRLLAEEDHYSYGDPDCGNLIVQGDNLEALKALLPFYAGQVKCIYIDPPYNTGSAFEHYDDNMEHTLWLSMMYPRLELLKQFLREDGFIFIQIDNNEMAYLKLVLDEIFGRNNFVNDLIWKRRGGSANPSNRLNNVTDFILWYSKTENYIVNQLFSLDDDNTQKYIEQRFNNIDENGRRFMKSPIQSPNPRPNLVYDYKGYKTPPKGYSISRNVMEKWDKEGKLWFPENKKQNINRKIYLDEYKGQPIANLWTDIKVINPMSKERNEFDGQKPESLIERVITLATNPGDLVLDSFLGSGTTAAVAHKMGRRYIGVEMGEQAKTHCATRLKKVIDGEQGGISEAVSWKGGGGFRFFTLGDTVFDSDQRIKSDISFENLAAHIFFTETKTPMKKPKKKSAFLGIHNDTVYALLYNGILGDKSPSGGNVLTHTTLNHIMNSIDAVSKKKGENLSFNRLVIYGEATRLPHAAVKSNSIVFKQIPYEIKVW